MELLANLQLGFETALSLNNLLYCFVGVIIGTAIGVLPGLGPVATISMLLPLTYGLAPVTSLIMLAGIYYGAQYGGSTTAILVNIPGEASAVITCLDGHEMAKQGRAGTALATAALGSFFAGTVGTVALAAFAPVLSAFALDFGSPDYFSLMVLGLIGAVVLAHGSVLKAIAMIFTGLLIGMVGADVNSGVTRFDFGIPELGDNIDFVTIAMGMFGFSEIIKNLEKPMNRGILNTKIKGFHLTKEDFKRAWPAVLRGTGLGTFLGILPGGGGVLASFSAYTIEKKSSKYPEEFGKGAIEGVAGPESANNAAAQTAFIPLLTLGIPPNSTMALMLGAMLISGVQPGPMVLSSNPDLFWGLVASMWIGNVLLVVLNLPLVGMWVKLLSIPYRYLFPAILVFCAIGLYSTNNSTFEIFGALVFAALGYFFVKLKCEPAPLLLGFILGPMMEEHFRRALVLSQGDFSVFLSRPISLTLLTISAGLLLLVVAPVFRKTRETAFQEED